MPAGAGRRAADVGLYFTDMPPARDAGDDRSLGSKAIDIPAGETRLRDRPMSTSCRSTSTLLSVYPHAHYLGSEMDASARRCRTARRGRCSTSPTGISTGSRTTATPRRSRCRAARPSTMRYTYDNCGQRAQSAVSRRARVVGTESSDEMGDLWLQVLPRSAADAATLARKSFRARDAR